MYSSWQQNASERKCLSPQSGFLNHFKTSYQDTLSLSLSFEQLQYTLFGQSAKTKLLTKNRCNLFWEKVHWRLEVDDRLRDVIIRAGCTSPVFYGYDPNTQYF